MTSAAERPGAAIAASDTDGPGRRTRAVLLSDLEQYIQRKRTERGGARPTHGVATPAHPRRTAVQEAVLTVLGDKEMSPGTIASEVAKLRDLPVSQKSVGIAIHELAKQGVIKMVGPALYRRVA